jgi:hypothetical protein
VYAESVRQHQSASTRHASPHTFGVQLPIAALTQGGARCASWPWAILPSTFGAKTHSFTQDDREVPMLPRRWTVAVVFCLGMVPVLAQSPSFDRVPEADKPALRKRFETEVWPLLVRGGKDGCVGCHTSKGGSLRLRGTADRDFDMMLKDGFFLPDDAGSLLGRVADTDKKRRMPPGERAAWTEAEIKTLRDFVMDLDKKQKK